MAVRHESPLDPTTLAALLVTWVVWGSTYLAIKIALSAFAPFVLMASRFVVAGCALMLVCRMRGEAWPSPRAWRNAIVVSALMIGGGMGLVAWAEQTVDSGLTALIIAIGPFVAAAFAAVYGQRVSTRERIAMAIGFIGVAVLASGPSVRSAPSGALAIVAAVVAWQWGSALAIHRLPLATGAMGYASEMVCGGLLLTLVALVLHEPLVPTYDARAIVAWAYLVVFGSLIAFSAYMMLIERVPPTVAASSSVVNPAIALGLGAWIGGEHLTMREGLGCGIVLVSVVLFVAAVRR